MTFELTSATLRRLCEVNSFEVPDAPLVFFGLRGAVPTDPDEYDFHRSRWVEPAAVDHIYPLCTIGQWNPGRGELAIFTGSTVPNVRYVAKAERNGGRGANQLMTGRYPDYRKGLHRASASTGHAAFRQTLAQAIRRSSDDLDYDEDDRVEVSNPYDNIHAGWCQGLEHATFASAGCQVITGYPQCRKREDAPAVGAWKRFHSNAYSLSQDSFVYILLNGRDAQRVAAAGDANAYPRLRFGSGGNLVKRVQRALAKRDIYEGKIDGDFGPRTLRAVLEFQTATFGPEGDDGIVGPVTAEALGLTWRRT